MFRKSVLVILALILILALAVPALAQGASVRLSVYDRDGAAGLQYGDKVVCQVAAEFASVATGQRAGVVLECVEKGGAQPGNIKTKVKPWERE